MYGINVSCCFRCVNSGKSCYVIDPFYSIVTLKGNKLLKESLWYELIKSLRLALVSIKLASSLTRTETAQRK